MLGSTGKSPPCSAQAGRVRELDNERLRLDRARAQAAARLVLQKKAQAIWGDDDYDTKKETDT